MLTHHRVSLDNTMLDIRQLNLLRCGLENRLFKRTNKYTLLSLASLKEIEQTKVCIIKMGIFFLIGCY